MFFPAPSADSGVRGIEESPRAGGGRPPREHPWRGSGFRCLSGVQFLTFGELAELHFFLEVPNEVDIIRVHTAESSYCQTHIVFEVFRPLAPRTHPVNSNSRRSVISARSSSSSTRVNYWEPIAP